MMHGQKNIKCRGLLLHLITHTHTHTHTHILCRNTLDEGSARRRDLYLTTHNTHNIETSMPPAGFKPTIPATGLPLTYALDRAATGIGISNYHQHITIIT